MPAPGGIDAEGTGASEARVPPERRGLRERRGIARAAVSLIADATERTIGVAAAVAAGVADALALELEPATRLNTIAVEASRNVVAHAYPDGSPGPLELRIATPWEGPRRSSSSLTVSVSDLGEGIALTPTPGDPPGLGLSMICALSDAIAIRSQPSRGMSLDATLAIGDQAAPVAVPAAEPRGTSLLSFGSVALLTAILPRALAAHVRDPALTLERLAETMVLGDAIARAVRSALSMEAPDVRFAPRGDDGRLRVRIGPLPAGGAERLVCAIGGEWRGSGPSLGLGTEAGADEHHDFALVDIALAKA